FRLRQVLLHRQWPLFYVLQKYIRYFASIARSFVFNSSRGEIQETVIQRKQCLSYELPKYFATQAVTSHTSNDSNLERNLKRLDQNVRRTGRISRRELEDILDELRHSGSATSTQSLHIIRCCGSLIPEESPAIRTHLVEEIWKTLDTLGVPLDISHYNALLRVYLENEYLFSPTEFLANLEKKGIEPNRVTYQRLIARYCQDGDIEGATKILEFMREKQLPVNESVFKEETIGHQFDMESAVGILGVMRQGGLEPSAETYTALLCGYAKKGDIEAIDSTLKECETKDIDLMDRDYMNIIFTLAINNHTQHVDKIIERMRQGVGYNQDAFNLILRLVNHGHEDIGYKILLTMPRPQVEKEQFHVGGFFISQLVKANCPVEKIKSICESLEKEDLNPRALLVATECSLQCGKSELAYQLFRIMQERNLPIRQHYFWPLLARHSKNPQSLLDILERMSSDFNLGIGGETLRDYVIPSLAKKSSDEIITLLKTSGVSVAAAASAIVTYHLNQNDIASAAYVAKRYNSHYSPILLKNPLVQAYIRTGDDDSFISILRQIHDSVDRVVPTGEDAPMSVPDRAEIVGQYINDVAAAIKHDRVTKIEVLLQGLLNQGLGLSNSAAERLQEKLGEELTDNVSSLLGKLTSGELVPVKVTRPAAQTQVKMLGSSGISKFIVLKSLEEKGHSTLANKKQLLLLYCRNRELEKAENLIKDLEENNFVFTGITYALMLDMYLHFENLEETNKILTKLNEREPDFVLDNSKIIRVATLLISKDKMSDAVKFLTEQAKERTLEDRSFQFSNLCFRLLNSLAEKGKIDELKQIFDILVEHGYIDINNVMLGPLIKVHVVRNDLAAALEKFEWCCQNYRSTPWKSELTRKFIQAEDPTSLQKLTDLSIQVHGEVNCLYDLVFAFVECGRIRQAHRILETPGLRSRAHRLNTVCERYQQEGHVEHLEGLVEATRDISHIDRLDIYQHLLLSYCKSDDPDKALGLWTRMQEENVQPSDEFLSTLGKFLIKKGRDVPFVLPEIDSSSQDVEKDVPTATHRLRQALRQNNLDQALELRKGCIEAGEDLTVTDVSTLIENLVKAERYREASALVRETLDRGLYPLPKVLRFFLNRLATAGDVDTITLVGNQLSNVMKKNISYDNRLCHANAVAGKSSEYLKKLTDEIDSADESGLRDLADKFPRGGAIGILEKHPELSSEYENLALKYAAKGFVGPVNVLWMHYFAGGKEDAALELWNKYLSGSPRVMFQHILRRARDNKDENIVNRLIKLLKDIPISEGARGTAYSCLIDILVYKQKLDEALVALKEAVDQVCLENLNRTALLRLKQSVEEQGKTFPYLVPAKLSALDLSSSSSSSSSDEEATRKRMHTYRQITIAAWAITYANDREAARREFN
ncbi:hypothetical protein L9F63_020226, partial [Diploptera punctata]